MGDCNVERLSGFGEALGFGQFKSAQSEHAFDSMVQWVTKTNLHRNQFNEYSLKLPEYLTLDCSRIVLTDEVVVSLKLPVKGGSNSVSMEASFTLSDTVNTILKYAAKKFSSLGLALPEPTSLPAIDSSSGPLDRTNRVLKVVGQDNYMIHGFHACTIRLYLTELQRK